MIGRCLVALLACHNRRTVTRAALETLFRQALPPDLSLDVILVDDGSSDGTFETVAERFPSVRLLRGDGSLYWNGAMALAQKAAMADAADAHLWLNDDVVLAENAIADLLAVHDGEIAAGRRPPIVVGAMVDPESGCPTYGGHVRRPGLHPFRFARVFASGQAATPCDSFNGNCLLVPRSAFGVLGPIDDAFAGGQPLGDIDYGLRAGRAGIPMLVAPRPAGRCKANHGGSPWETPGRPLGERLASLSGPLGPARRQTATFYRRHGGWAWPFWWATHVGRCLWAGFRPRARRRERPRLAMIEPVLPWYRLPLLTRLRDSGQIDVEVFHGTSHPEGEPDCDPPPAIRHHRSRNFYWPRGGDRILWCNGVWKVLFGGYDVVLMAEHVYTASNWLIWLASRLLGRPRIILTGHFNLDAKPENLIARLRRAWIRGADYLAAYTSSGERQCRAIGIPLHRIEVLGNTLDVEAIRTQAASVQGTRPAPAEGGPAVFLFIGRLYRDKMAPLAAEAVATLNGMGHPALLLVVGEGSDRAELERLAREGSPVRVLGECRDPADLARLFAQAQAAIMPDAAGLAVVHAFAHGIPVVIGPGSRHRVEVEYLRHGENGLRAEALTARSLAEQMRRLLTEPGLADALRAGAERTADGLSMDLYAQRLEALVARAARD
ncbi:glycosyltransferase [Paramagnetospirillum magneticum]|uniref:Glycosyltransferase n=1 Tax=Paramagnetospirillum magneticum (strain ATCC 700264 / AMB-1) TaxID=342108 RepID=Q2W7C9_PARM1|nr:glycosyltransferase [Paramagnetospirillum magneticum]BAE50246.1 hypothetical protein amb1442 [Paramagnetospirillum magneticum AMB-1]